MIDELSQLPEFASRRIIRQYQRAGIPGRRVLERGQRKERLLDQTWLLVGMVVVFVLFVILPQSLQRRRHEQELAAIQEGDWIVSIGGIIGQVIALTESELRLRISETGELTLVRRAVRARIPARSSFMDTDEQDEQRGEAEEASEEADEETAEA